jgi:hypothetical protein
MDFRGVDTVRRLRAVFEAMVIRDDVVLAIFLDGVNAFNTMPWERIMEALQFFEVPYYLVRLTQAYFNDRWIGYTGKEAYDKVLRYPLLLGTAMVLRG